MMAVMMKKSDTRSQVWKIRMMGGIVIEKKWR